MATTSVVTSWHAAYPAPRISPATIRREDVLDMIKRSAETSSRDYVLIDLRRNDFEVCNMNQCPMLLFEELSNVGWYYPQFNQSPRAELAPYYTNLVHTLQRRRPLQNHLVLLYVSSHGL
jgi:hypothetical protein